MRKTYDEPAFDLYRFCIEDIMAKSLNPSDPEQGQGGGDPGSGGDPFEE